MHIFTKISTSILLITELIAGLSSYSTAQTIQIDHGASSAATYSVGPIYMSSTLYYKYSRYAYLYTQDELAAAGILPGATITTLGWMKSTSSSSVGPATLNIYMKNSSQAAYSNASETWANLSAGATLSYSNTSQSIPATASPNYIDFTLNTPFIYTGGSLEILTEWDASASSTPLATGAFEWVNTQVVDRIYASGNSTPPTTLSSTMNNINMDNKRPVIQFKLLENPCTNPVVAGEINISQSTTVCPNTTLNLDLTGYSTGSGISFEWESSTTNTAGSYTSLGSSQTTPPTTVQPIESTWYRCKVTCLGGTPAYTTPAQVIVDIVTVDLGADTTTCSNNTSIVLDAGNPGATYLWDDGSTQQTRIVTTAGTFSVTVTSAAGCTANSSITVNHFPDAAGDFTATETTEATVSFAATATNATTYFWQFGTNNATATGTNVSYTYPDNGTYTVTLNLINDCGDTTKVSKPVTVSTSTVSIVEVESDTKVSVYPNPATSELFIVNESNIMIDAIQVVDMFGKTIYSTPVGTTENKHSIDIKQLTSGTYYLKLQTPQGFIVKAFNVL